MKPFTFEREAHWMFWLFLVLPALLLLVALFVPLVRRTFGL